jgi:hypothetical protein
MTAPGEVAMNALKNSNVRAIANAILYEGYVLYPYRSTALKNRKRFNFGVLAPEAVCLGSTTGVASRMQTECIALGHARTLVEVTVRFLHLVTRTLQQTGSETGSEAGSDSDEGIAQASWQEAVEVDVIVPPHRLAEVVDHADVDRTQSWQQQFACPATRTVEPLDEDRGVIVRTQEKIEGRVELSAQCIAEQVFKITTRILNTTPAPTMGDTCGMPRPDELLDFALVSTHTILALEGGEFVSSLDPPAVWHQAVRGCHNVGTWPVLVGDARRRDLMLSSPIILYDYPEVAPESPGDFFDGAEIDEMLALRILTLTDEEKEQMRQCDDRTRRLLERTEALAPEQLMKLHGAARRVASVRSAGSS